MRLQACVLAHRRRAAVATMLGGRSWHGADRASRQVRQQPDRSDHRLSDSAGRKRSRTVRGPRSTVTKRSYLDPGKESKAPGMTWSSFPADSPQGLFYDPTANCLHFNNRTRFRIASTFRASAGREASSSSVVMLPTKEHPVATAPEAGAKGMSKPGAAGSPVDPGDDTEGTTADDDGASARRGCAGLTGDTAKRRAAPSRRARRRPSRRCRPPWRLPT